MHANPAEGYTFERWTVNGNQVSTNANYTFTVTSNQNLVAHFSQEIYTITVSANPSNGGTVYGGGTYNAGATCTLYATANSGYEFVHWKKGNNIVSTNATYSFTVNASTAGTYTAYFQQSAPTQYTITASVSPSNAGTITGAGSYPSGSTCTLDATPNDGYTFVNWIENDTLISTNATYSFTVTRNRNLVAVFDIATTNYEILVSANPLEGGTVTGGGTYTQGQQCTVKATPNPNYTFSKWTENGNVVSTRANYTFTVTGSRTLVANFTMQQFTITATADPEDGGTVTGGGTYPYGATCVLTATAHEGYTFVKWMKDNTIVTNNSTCLFEVTENASFTAIFTPIQQYTITVMANPEEGGIVEGGGQYYHGATCILHASANEGYYFVKWTKDGSDISELPDYSFEVTENATYEAHFFQGSGGYTISVRANPEEGGSVAGSGTYAQGMSITLTATTNEGYEFINWMENGVIQCLSNEYPFVVDRNRVVVANFEQLPVYTISSTAGANGSIDPQGDVQVVKGSDITFTFRPDFGFRITSVLVDDNDIGRVDTYTFTNVDCNHTIFVSFSGWDIEEYSASNVEVYFVVV